MLDFRHAFPFVHYPDRIPYRTRLSSHETVTRFASLVGKPAPNPTRRAAGCRASICESRCRCSIGIHSSFHPGQFAAPDAFNACLSAGRNYNQLKSTRGCLCSPDSPTKENQNHSGYDLNCGTYRDLHRALPEHYACWGSPLLTPSRIGFTK
jgi:hypothetical protein